MTKKRIQDINPLNINVRFIMALLSNEVITLTRASIKAVEADKVRLAFYEQILKHEKDIYDWLIDKSDSEFVSQVFLISLYEILSMASQILLDTGKEKNKIFYCDRCQANIKQPCEYCNNLLKKLIYKSACQVYVKCEILNYLYRFV
jgi:hypothetical protein